MDIGISSTADLASSSWSLSKSSNTAAIPENETFRQVLQNASGKTDTPEKIEGAAKQFEALMIGQMLKTARESSGGGWLSDEDDQDDQSGSLVMELAEQGFSQALAARGGLGLAKTITANLERSTSLNEPSNQPAQSKTPSFDLQSQPEPLPLEKAPMNTDLPQRPSPPLALPQAQAPARLRRPER
jgi:Rod binding domain-containing protein